MRIDDIKNYIDKFSNFSVVDNPKMEDFSSFLLGSIEDNIPTHIFNKMIYLNSLILPKNKLGDNFIDELLDWSLSPNGNQYGYGYSGKNKLISKPYDGSSPPYLGDAESIFFIRRVFNYTEQIIELNQKLAHILDISWHEPENSFCKIDENGDHYTVATIEDSENLELCTITRKELFFYLYLTDSVLIRFFEAERREGEWDLRINEKVHELKNDENEIYANLYYKKDDNGNCMYSVLRGFQIIRNNVSDDAMFKILTGTEEREYEDFLIHDWKNDQVIKWSSNPQQLGNYFVPSDLPFETSPAYFRHEVLSKYKNDQDKYEIQNRKIYCRGTWDLRYGLNDANQVFVYIIDLSGLPITEQLYWKAFNEKSKARIPKSIFETDFEGKWTKQYNPLNSLKNSLNKIPNIKIKNIELPIWAWPKTHKTKNIDALNNLISSKKDWETQVDILHKNIIEGLKEKNIKKLSNELDCEEKDFRSIKQLERCLEKVNIEKNMIDMIINPFKELNYYRSEIISHTSPDEYPKENLKEHFDKLLAKCDISIQELSKIIEKGLLDSDI